MQILSKATIRDIKMLKTIPLLLETMLCPMYVFVVPIIIAHKMVTTNSFASQNAFINFYKLQPKTNQTKTNKKTQHEKLHHFEPKFLKMTF